MLRDTCHASVLHNLYLQMKGRQTRQAKLLQNSKLALNGLNRAGEIAHRVRALAVKAGGHGLNLLYKKLGVAMCAYNSSTGSVDMWILGTQCQLA